MHNKEPHSLRKARREINLQRQNETHNKAEKLSGSRGLGGPGLTTLPQLTLQLEGLQNGTWFHVLEAGRAPGAEKVSVKVLADWLTY